MKKVSLTFLAISVFFALGVFCIRPDAADAVCQSPEIRLSGGNAEDVPLCPFKYKETGELLTITDYEIECGGKLVIPEKIVGKTVAAIEDSAFSGRNDLVEVTVPESVIAIGEYAFANCQNLTTVYMPGAEDCEFDHTTFYNCPKLSGIDTGNGIITGFNDNIGVIPGSFDKEESVLLCGMKTHPFKPFIPVENCLGFTLDITITKYTGYPFGKWLIYTREGDGEWENIAEFEIHEEMVGETETSSFVFDEPVSFDSLALVQKDAVNHSKAFSMRLYDVVCYFPLDGK